MTQEINDILSRTDPLKDAILDIRDVYAEPEPLITIDEKVLISAGNISSIVGPPKSRKTFLATLIVGAYFAGDIERLKASEIPGHVLWIDTEQAPGHCMKTYRRINLLRQRDEFLPQNDLHYLMLRKYSPQQRLELTRIALERFSPRLVVIDGVADLIEANNSEVDAIHLQDFLLSQSQVLNCHIINIIHSNAGSDKGRGHTGASLTRKSEIILTLSPDLKHDRTNVTPQSRNITPEPFSFRVDDDGLPTFSVTSQQRLIDYPNLVRAVISSREYVGYTDLVGRIIKFREKEGYPISERYAKGLIHKMYEKRLIYRSKNKQGYCRAHPENFKHIENKMITGETMAS